MLSGHITGEQESNSALILFFQAIGIQDLDLQNLGLAFFVRLNIFDYLL